jgi:hypothetical protein
MRLTLKGIILIAIVALLFGFYIARTYADNMGMGMGMGMGTDGTGGGSYPTVSTHRLFIDGSSNVLIIDGTNNELLIDGAS